jgi:hypothetical protein
VKYSVGMDFKSKWKTKNHSALSGVSNTVTIETSDSSSELQLRSIFKVEAEGSPDLELLVVM